MPDAASFPAERRRVLIVEDELEVCEILADVVAEDGFEARCVRSDSEAYEALSDDDGFTGMIVDVNLGAGTTGFDVARFARRLDPSLPVIYVSGQSSEASYAANSVPGSLFVAKPFTAEELLDQLRRLVGDNDD